MTFRPFPLLIWKNGLSFLHCNAHVACRSFRWHIAPYQENYLTPKSKHVSLVMYVSLCLFFLCYIAYNFVRNELILTVRFRILAAISASYLFPITLSRTILKHEDWLYITSDYACLHKFIYLFNIYTYLVCIYLYNSNSLRREN